MNSSNVNLFKAALALLRGSMSVDAVCGLVASEHYFFDATIAMLRNGRGFGVTIAACARACEERQGRSKS